MGESQKTTKIKYSDLVNYKELDPVKKLAMEHFGPTLRNTERLNIRVMPVGETAAVLDFLDTGERGAKNKGSSRKTQDRNSDARSD